MEPTKLEIPEIAGELWMYTHPANDIYISESIRNNRNWEPFETGILAAHLRPGDTMVDLGANIGYYSLVAAAIVGDSGRVYAFEPDPGNFELLQRNIELNGFHQIHARNEAVSDAAGVTRLFLSAENQGSIAFTRRATRKLAAGGVWRWSVSISIRLPKKKGFRRT